MPESAHAPTPENANPAPYAAAARIKRTTVRDIQAFKERGERFATLTSYDRQSAAVFDEAGISLLLIGDSAGNNMLAYDDTLPVTVDELLPMCRAVVRGAPHALVVADLPFGSYQESPQQALATAVRMVKEGGVQAVKLEGGAALAPAVHAIVAAGVPVVAHLGFTPQSLHAFGGYRVQGRGADGDQIVADAVALAEAGAFAIVLEMVPAEVASRVTATIPVPTIGIGAGPDCDGQILVWMDMAGLSPRPMPKLVKSYADLRGTLLDAARAYAQDVQAGSFPGPEHSYS
ncbi:MAG TPA: 3-methyl-2-oxobutanoate hydroxymethyltransferase [Mycobacteriales bacterium]|jgi:3-methyl-2-oxobutanoate hydroxymethyltransferase|nr:3-methyl-2-oxobutanoate hydroxymethyltransferase [Mycobacteriales bacterium]